MEVRQIGNVMPTKSRDNPNQGRVYSTDGLCPTLTKMDGGGRQPMIIEDVKRIGGLSEAKTQSRSVYDVDGVSPTLCSGMDHGNTMPYICQKSIVAMPGVHRIESQYRIRKLTPNETWRLMDFSDEDFYKAEAVNSNTQLYKQAGNSIVRNVLVAIFGQMIPGKEEVYKET